MPRRKQQAPRRLSAFLSDDELKTTAEDEDGAPGSDAGDEETLQYADCSDGELSDERATLGDPYSPAATDGERSTPDVSDKVEKVGGNGETMVRDEVVAGERDSDSQSSEDSVCMNDCEIGLSLAEKPWKENGGESKSPIATQQDSVLETRTQFPELLSSSFWSSMGYHHLAPPVLQPYKTESTVKDQKVHLPSIHSSTGSGNSGCFDWHETALAKTLQTSSLGLTPSPCESSLFSTVQLYRQSGKLFGPIFTGASKFRCRDCSGAYDTLVELTVHMSATGHYRDDNRERERDGPKRWCKPRKRSLLEMEGKEDAQKVLRCMYCGHSFESLQDLSVHMIKTKHYQKVPLKEPVPAVASAKLTTSIRKRLQAEAPRNRSPDRKAANSSCGMGTGPTTDSAMSSISQKGGSSPYMTSNNRYGYQNGASYAWQFEAKKSQILKCMECGSSHDTLQQLTAHMMVTGHFVKVTSSSVKKNRHIVFDPITKHKVQSVPLPPTNVTPSHISPAGSPAKALASSPNSVAGKPLASTPGTKVKSNAQTTHVNFSTSMTFASLEPPTRLMASPSGSPAKCSASPRHSPNQSLHSPGNITLPMKSPTDWAKPQGKSPDSNRSTLKVERDKGETEEKGKDSKEVDTSSQYLREEDLESTPTTGLDILKSLENTVATAINKAQNGTPSWSGYPSIHAAYQLSGMVKSAFQSEIPLGPGRSVRSGHVSVKSREHCPQTPPLSLSPTARLPPPPPPPPLPTFRGNVFAMEELVNKVSENLHQGDNSKTCLAHSTEGHSPASFSGASSPCKSDDGRESTRENQLPVCPQSIGRDGPPIGHLVVRPPLSPGLEPVSNGSSTTPPTPREPIGALAIITDHSLEEPPINPLSALQSIMDLHLGKALRTGAHEGSKSIPFRSSWSGASDKPATLPSTLPLPPRPPEMSDRGITFYCGSPDQPIDLTKGKRVAEERKGILSSMYAGVVSGENALADISDMVRTLTGGGRLTPKPPTPASTPSERSETDGSIVEDPEDPRTSPIQRRKGRQSNWNPHHLLILQAQFAASMHPGVDGKLAISELGSQERAHISRITGLSMTTISHWLANVKYQLRRTGGTKFLKHMDSGQPVFHCSDCASQFQSPAGYVGHLEMHLGFHLRDLARLPTADASSPTSANSTRDDGLPSAVPSPERAAAVPLPLAGEDESGAALQCRLCGRSFSSRHAVKLHLSKTHGKSPEDHLLFVADSITQRKPR
uniref:Teashirt zinc finger homeobox 1 n=1 Tax=Eptatretus burgeri TaxID=7764 RepID=A0A8C4QYH8_EPTBU